MGDPRSGIFIDSDNNSNSEGNENIIKKCDNKSHNICKIDKKQKDAPTVARFIDDNKGKMMGHIDTNNRILCYIDANNIYENKMMQKLHYTEYQYVVISLEDIIKSDDEADYGCFAVCDFT